MSNYGYMPYYKPIAQRNTSGLAAAAAAKDPYGLAPNNRSGPLGIGSASGFAAPIAPRTPSGGISADDPRVKASLAANPQASRGGYAGPTMGSQLPTSTPPTPGGYDLNTDPALQQIQALVGMSNEQAQAQALKQRQQLLLGYGDPTLASSILGADDPTVEAAGQNPTSTVSQLHQQRDRNLHDLTEGLNKDNLAYSGYRVQQEQQAGEDFQNALAQAAAGVNQSLGGVDENLLAALTANNGQLAAGIDDAASRASAQAGQTGIDPGAIDPNALAAAAAGGGEPDPQSSGLASAVAGANGPQVGSTTNDLIYRLLGRKTDPRYDAFG